MISFNTVMLLVFVVGLLALFGFIWYSSVAGTIKTPRTEEKDPWKEEDLK